MKKITDDIISLFTEKSLTSSEPRLNKEILLYLDSHPLSDAQKSILTQHGTETHNGFSFDIDNNKGLSDYIAHGFKDAISAKRAGPISQMMDFAQASDLTTEIQELHTLLQDLHHNMDVIFPDADGYLEEFKNKISHFATELAIEMDKNGIKQEEKRPTKGAEFFTPIQKTEWEAAKTAPHHNLKPPKNNL